MEFVVLFIRGLLAWILISAAVQKFWQAWSKDDAADTMFSRLPRLVGRGLVGTEFAIGLALFLPVVWPYAAAAAGVLLAAFAVATAREASRRMEGDCGCGGLLPVGERVSYRHAVLVGSGAVLAFALAGAGTPLVGNIGSGGGVVGVMIVMMWGPVMLLTLFALGSRLHAAVSGRANTRGGPLPGGLENVEQQDVLLRGV